MRDNNDIQELALKFIETKSEKDFNVLYHRLKTGLFFHVLKKVKDEEISKDIVSVVFTKVWRKIQLYNTTNAFSTWIYSIANNETIDYFRRNKPVYFLDINGEDNENIIINKCVSKNFAVSHQEWEIEQNSIFTKSICNTIINEIENLPIYYKDVMIDRVINDMRYDAIALKYGLNMNTLKGKLKRGKSIIIEKHKELNEIVKAYVRREPKEFVEYAEMEY